MGPLRAIRQPSPSVGVLSLIFCAQKIRRVGSLYLLGTILHWMSSFLIKLVTVVSPGPTMGPTTGKVDMSGIPGSAGSAAVPPGSRVGEMWSQDHEKPEDMEVALLLLGFRKA